MEEFTCLEKLKTHFQKKDGGNIAVPPELTILEHWSGECITQVWSLEGSKQPCLQMHPAAVKNDKKKMFGRA